MAVAKIGWKPGKHVNVVIDPARAKAARHGIKAHIYTAREAGALLRHSAGWVRKQIKAGRIRAVRLGVQVFIPEREILRLKGIRHGNCREDAPPTPSSPKDGLSLPRL